MLDQRGSAMGERTLPEEYADLIVMATLGLSLCEVFLGLGSRLRSAALRRGGPAALSKQYLDAETEADDALGEPDSGEAGMLARRHSLALYFFAATLAVLLHASLVFFYIWGATLGETGATGFVAILCLAACLLVGLIHAWSRGVADALRRSGS